MCTNDVSVSNTRHRLGNWHSRTSTHSSNTRPARYVMESASGAATNSESPARARGRARSSCTRCTSTRRLGGRGVRSVNECTRWAQIDRDNRVPGTDPSGAPPHGRAVDPLLFPSLHQMFSGFRSDARFPSRVRRRPCGDLQGIDRLLRTGAPRGPSAGGVSRLRGVPRRGKESRRACRRRTASTLG